MVDKSHDTPPRRLNAHPDRYDVLVTDLTMPEMHGLELASRVAELQPDLPVVLVSGHGDAMLAQGRAGANVRLRLSKPVDMDALLSGIE